MVSGVIVSCLLAYLRFTDEIIGIFFVYMWDFKKVMLSSLKMAVKSEVNITLSFWPQDVGYFISELWKESSAHKWNQVR